MSVTDRVEAMPQLGDFGNVVPDGYTFRRKRVTPREDLSLANAYFKWYDLYAPDAEITPAQREEARTFVAAEVQRLQLAHELGFIILHHAGPVLLLLVTTWRNTNELWESIYVKEVAGARGYAPLEFAQSHRGTFCVWELAPIWHERQAWTRFLSSPRDERAKRAYVDDRFAGLV